MAIIHLWWDESSSLSRHFRQINNKQGNTMTNRNNILIGAYIAAIMATTVVAAPPSPSFDTDRILDAIMQVETGGHEDPSNAVGDNGKAIGPFQIHMCYWQDAVAHDKSIGGCYADCRDEAYARRIVMAYLSRYCKWWDNETVARIHNGGPKGASKSATLGYWRKVQKHL